MALERMSSWRMWRSPGVETAAAGHCGAATSERGFGDKRLTHRCVTVPDDHWPALMRTRVAARCFPSTGPLPPPPVAT
jgi:hypothetical protein